MAVAEEATANNQEILAEAKADEKWHQSQRVDIQ